MLGYGQSGPRVRNALRIPNYSRGLMTSAVAGMSSRLAASRWRLTSLMRPRAVKLAILLLPTLLATFYLFFIATDQYESEASFVVRSAAKPEIPGGLAFLMQVGLGRSQDDSFVVQEYISSRDALEKLRATLPLLEMYGRKEADFLTRYPSIFYGPTEEELYNYLKHFIFVVHADKTGISRLQVRAFRPEDAQRIARTLLDLSEDLVNRINRRLQRDAIDNRLTELNTSQDRLIEAQAILTEFRNRELMIDPTKNAVALGELISHLSIELAATRAQITEMMSGSAASPQLVGLRRKASAIEEQIARERARIANDSEGLAARLATYERLNLERTFADKMVSAAESDLAKARFEAARKLLYLERVIEPNLSDYSTWPKRIRAVLTVFAANALLLLIGWLIVSGIREHAPAQ